MEKTSRRLLSLDAFRGFDMLMIIGFDGIMRALAKLMGADWLAEQFNHPSWDGFTFYDTIFPTFLFIAGISFPYSYAKQLEKGLSKLTIHLRILKRAALLVFFGMLVNGFLKFDFETMRYGSVLGKIGISWALAAIVYVNFGRRARLGICAALIVVYAVLLRTFAAPDMPAGTDPLSLKGCFVGWLDRLYMPGQLYLPQPYHAEGIEGFRNLMDPSGINVNLFSTATALLGMFAGDLVRAAGTRRTTRLLAYGAGLLVAGLVTTFVIPLNKMLWSPSFTLVCGGYSALMFAAFYWVVDVRGWTRWTPVLRIVGVNAITIYMLQCIVQFSGISKWFLGGLASKLPEDVGALLLATGVVVLKLLLLGFLDRKKVYLKV